MMRASNLRIGALLAATALMGTLAVPRQAAAQDAAQLQSIEAQIGQLQAELRKLKREAADRDAALRRAQQEAAQARAEAHQAMQTSRSTTPSVQTVVARRCSRPMAARPMAAAMGRVAMPSPSARRTRM